MIDIIQRMTTPGKIYIAHCDRSGMNEPLYAKRVESLGKLTDRFHCTVCHILVFFCSVESEQNSEPCGPGCIELKSTTGEMIHAYDCARYSESTAKKPSVITGDAQKDDTK